MRGLLESCHLEGLKLMWESRSTLVLPRYYESCSVIASMLHLCYFQAALRAYSWLFVISWCSQWASSNFLAQQTFWRNQIERFEGTSDPSQSQTHRIPVTNSPYSTAAITLEGLLKPSWCQIGLTESLAAHQELLRLLLSLSWARG